MGPWTYLACTLLTNGVITELPLANVSFSDPLNAPGQLNAELPLTGGGDILTLLEATEPWHSCLYIKHTVEHSAARTGWGGVWTSRSYDSKTQKLTVQAQQFDAYFNRRILTEKRSYHGLDQFTIFRGLIDYAQSKPGGDIGVLTGSGLSGVTRSIDYPALQNILAAGQDLAALDNGFDYTIEMRDGSGRETPDKILVLSHPQRGRPPGTTGLVIIYPGNNISYTWPEDPSGFATDTWGSGSGIGEKTLTAHARTTELLTGRYPLLEQTVSYPDVKRQALLDARVTADQRAARMLKTLPTFTLPVDGDPAYGTYITGDYARVMITDPSRFPRGIDTTMRITQLDVRASAGNQPDSVTLTLDPSA